MSTPLPPYLEREKLIHGLLIEFKRVLPNYAGIERKRLERRIKEMEGYLKELKQ